MKPALRTPTPAQGGSASSTQTHSPAQQFIFMALNMSWQLAIVILVPVIGGVFLDKAVHTSHIFLFVGLALAAIGMGVVLWQTLQSANSLPVPKLTAEQRREVQKSYEEDDE